MAEIMMLNNSTSTIQQNPSLSLGKESLKTRGGEAEDLALNFGNFLRASKEENGKEERKGRQESGGREAGNSRAGAHAGIAAVGRASQEQGFQAGCR